MNKNRYRIIFNKARGMMMAVAETASSHSSNPSNSKGMQGAGPSDSAPTAPRGQFQLQALTALLLANTLILPNVAQAQIFADASAPANQRPDIGATNGIPRIDIQTPNAQRVSYNRYTQMDILSNGVVINNSRTGVPNSVLAGQIPANSRLGAGEARTIVNEVRSTAPTRFEGNLEIAGGNADVIIANPAGINVAGAGFINANRATLTTGTPNLDAAGNLTGYTVNRGVVNINPIVTAPNSVGSILNRPFHLDVLARAVNINANARLDGGVFSTNIVTGTNQISTDLSQVNAQAASSTGRPSFALDVAALGGIYSGSIHMIGTESGVGVRNQGLMQAQQHIQVTSAGRIENTETGVMRSFGRDGTIALTTTDKNPSSIAGDLLQRGSIEFVYGEAEGRSNIVLNASRDVDLRGRTAHQKSLVDTTVAQGTDSSIAIVAGRNATLHHSAQVNSAGDVIVDAKDVARVFTATVNGGKDVMIKGGTEAALLKDASRVNAQNNIIIQSDNRTRIDGGRLNSSGSTMINGGEVTIDNIHIQAGKDVLIENTSSAPLTMINTKIDATGHIHLDSRGQVYLNSFRDIRRDSAGNPLLDNNGNIQYFANWSPTTTNTFTAGGQFSMDSRWWQHVKNTSITAGAIDLKSGSGMSLQGSNTLHTQHSNLLHNNTQTRAMNGLIQIENKNALTLSTTDNIRAHRGLNVNITNLLTVHGDRTVNRDNATANIFVNQGQLNIQAGGLRNLGGYIYAPTLNAAFGTQGVINEGSLVGRHQLTLQSAGSLNNSGTISTTHAGTDNILAITTTDQRPTASAGDITNTGSISADGLLLIDAGRDLHNRKTIQQSKTDSTAPIIINTGRDINLNTAALVENKGTGAVSLAAGQNINMHTASVVSQSAIYLDTAENVTLNNSNSKLLAGQDVSVVAADAINSTNGVISAQAGNLHLEASQPLNLGATTASTSSISLNGGTVNAGQAVNLVADHNISINPATLTAGSLNAQAGNDMSYQVNTDINTQNSINLVAGNLLEVFGNESIITSQLGSIDLKGGEIRLHPVSLRTNSQNQSIQITANKSALQIGNKEDGTYLNSQGDIKIQSLLGGINLAHMRATSTKGIVSILGHGNVNFESKVARDGEGDYIAISLEGDQGVNLGSIGTGSLNFNAMNLTSTHGDIQLLAGQNLGNVKFNPRDIVTVSGNQDYLAADSRRIRSGTSSSSFNARNISIKADKGDLFLDQITMNATQGNLAIQAGQFLDLRDITSTSAQNTAIASGGGGILTLNNLNATAKGHMAISSDGQIYMNSVRETRFDSAGNILRDGNGNVRYFANWSPSTTNTLNADGILSINSSWWQHHKNTNYTGGAINVSSGSGLSFDGAVNWNARGSDLIRNDDSLLEAVKDQPQRRVHDLDGELSIQAKRSYLTLTPSMNFTATGDIDIRARDQLRMTGIAGTNGNASAQRVSLEAGKSITLTAGDMLLEAPRIIAKGGNLNLISTGSTANTRNSIIVNPIRNTFVNYLAPEKVTYLERGIQELNADINAITSTQAYASYQSRLHTLYSLDTPSDRTTRIKEQTINQLHDEFAYLRIPLENLNQEKTVLQHSIEMVKGAATKGWEHLGAELTGEVVNLKSAGGIQLTSANIRGNDFVNIEAAGLLPAETLQVQQFDANNNPVLDANGKPVFFEKQVERASIIIDGTSDYFEYGTQGSNNYGFAAYQNPSEITARNNINVKTGGLTWDHRLVINGANLVTDMNLVDSDNFDLFDIHSGEEYEYIRTGDINLQSFGDISLEATQEELFRFSSNSYKTGKWYKRKYVTETRTNNAVTAYGTSLVANNINLYAGRNIDAYASEFSARGDIAFRATGHRDDPTSGQLNLYAYDEKISSQYTSHQKSKFLGLTYKDTKFNSSRVLHTQLPVSSSSKRFEASTGGSITLVGTQFETRAGVRLHAGTGPQAQANAQIVLKGIVETVTEEKRRESNSVVWQKMEGKGSTTQTLDLPKFTGPVAPELIAPSISIDVANNPDGLDAEIDKLLKNPAYSYLKDIRVREGVNWNQIELELDKWEYEQEGLTPAGAALVAIAVAIASGGTGIGAATTIGGKMGAAAMTALQSQAAITLVNNKGDIGKTLKDLESSDTIKQMATAALTAGLLDVVAGSLNLPLKPEGYLENMYVSTVNSIGSALVSTAVNGGSLSENLEQGLIAGLANGLHAGLAGDIKGLENQYVLHKIMHAAAGCLAASAQRQACEAGAIGAAVGEIVAEMMPAPNPNLSQAEFEAAQTKIREASKLIAGTVAAYTGHDVNTAANIADTAIKNNRQLHEREISLLKQEAKKLAGQQGWSEQDWYNALYSVAFAQVDTKGNQTLQVAIDQLGQATALNENTLLGQNKFESISQNLKIAEGVINTLASQNQTIYYADGQTVVKDASGGIVRAFQATPTQLVNNSLFGQNPLLSNGSVQYRIDPIQLSLNRSALGNIASQKDIVDFFKNQFSAVATAGSGRVDAVYPEFELWGMLGLARGTAAGVTRTIQEMRNNALLNRIEGLGFRANLNAHLPNFDGFSKVGVSGAHNLKVFEDLSKTEGVIINSRTKISEGIWRYEYQIPAMDPRKPGTITHYKSQQTKTVYDPNVYSDAKILSMAQRAAQQNFQTNKQVYINSLNGGPIKNQYSNNIEGVNFQVYLGRDTHGNVYVTNVHPK